MCVCIYIYIYIYVCIHMWSFGQIRRPPPYLTGGDARDGPAAPLAFAHDFLLPSREFTKGGV